jgi:hypothetical protein
MSHTQVVSETAPPPKTRTIELPDVPRAAGSRAPAPARARRFAVTSRTSWLIPPAFLFATLLGVSIVLSGPLELYGFALTALFVVGVLWTLISVFFPGRAELSCPRCSAPALERLSLDSVTGIRCSACGFEDPDASSWMIAEQEGVPLEGIVMKNRRRKEAGPSADHTPGAN